MYSVEWIPKTSEYDCWNQWYSGSNRLMARIQYFEMLMVFQFSSDMKFRIRKF